MTLGRRFHEGRDGWIGWVLAPALAALLVACAGSEGKGEPTAGAVPLPRSWERVPAEARDALRAAAARCAREPQSPEAFTALARHYHGLELVDLAERSYRRAIELGATEAETSYLLAVLLREHGEVDEAARLFAASIEKQPDYAPAHHNLGLCLLDLGRAAEAVEALERAVGLAPGEASFRASLGRAHRERGDLPAAEAELRRALEADPALSAAHQQLGLLLVTAHRESEAEPHFAAVRSQGRQLIADPWLEQVQRESDTFASALDRASAYLDEHRTDEAIALLSGLERSHPGRAEVPRLLARSLARAGRVQEAVDSYVRARQLAPEHCDTRAELAAMLLQHGHQEGAEREAREAVSLDRGCDRAWVVLASLALQRSRPEEALEILGPLVQRGVALAGAHVVRGEALTRLARHAEAVEAFKRAVDLDPALEYPHRRLGLAYREVGNREDALRELERALRIDPRVEETRRAIAALRGPA